MKHVYTIKSGGFLEVHGSIKSAYESAAACYQNPVFSKTSGEPGPDCKIEYIPASLEQCKGEIKNRGYYDIEESGDDTHTTEIMKQFIIR